MCNMFGENDIEFVLCVKFNIQTCGPILMRKHFEKSFGRNTHTQRRRRTLLISSSCELFPFQFNSCVYVDGLSHAFYLCVRFIRPIVCQLPTTHSQFVSMFSWLWKYTHYFSHSSINGTLLSLKTDFKCLLNCMSYKPSKRFAKSIQNNHHHIYTIETIEPQCGNLVFGIEIIIALLLVVIHLHC